MVAIFGKPNVGKSTIINKILQQKLCITSRKPQTTRHRILGIYTQDNYQIAFVDTPGLHKENKVNMNKIMNKTATAATKDVEVIYFVVDSINWNHLDDHAVNQLQKNRLDYTKCILVINKVDKIADKDSILPLINELKNKYKFDDIVPISARTGQNLDQLIQATKSYLYESDHCYPEDIITDKPAKFVVSELIREKIIHYTGDELPYATNVAIESFQITPKNTYIISALINIERTSQKKMIIGSKGERIKTIGQAARKDIEELLGNKVFLRLWVKVKNNWRDNILSLCDLGQ